VREKGGEERGDEKFRERRTDLEKKKTFSNLLKTQKPQKLKNFFTSWVAPDVCARFGIEPSAEAAWERRAREEAGGASSSSSSSHASSSALAREKLKLSQRGWSDARVLAATKLRANPNSFFYRHVEPGQQQAHGEWTEGELALFLRAARRHGVGDRWGLFSSWIPQRVGYQASAFYRDVVIPAGLVVDARFRMTRTGRALFVGG
jgi:hypothetical protein